MQISIDISECILCGACTALCPDVFNQTTEKVEIDPTQAQQLAGHVMTCVEVCPMACIHVQ